MSVSVPVDLELTGLRVPSTLSSRKILSGDGGIAEATLGLPTPPMLPPLEVIEAIEVDPPTIGEVV